MSSLSTDDKKSKKGAVLAVLIVYLLYFHRIIERFKMQTIHSQISAAVISLALFITGTVFATDFTPMNPLFGSSSGNPEPVVKQPELLQLLPPDTVEAPSSEPAANGSAPLNIPDPPEDVDLDLTIIPAPPTPTNPVPAPSDQIIESAKSAQYIENQIVEKQDNSKDVVPASSGNSIANNNNSEYPIAQVGFLSSRVESVPNYRIARSTLPDPDLTSSTASFTLTSYPDNGLYSPPNIVSFNSVSTSDSAPATKIITKDSHINASETLPTPPAKLPAKLTAKLPQELDVEGSNPQMVRDDYDYQQLREELLGEIEKRAWRSGDFQIIPYGKLWASMSYETKPTQIGSAPFFVTDPSNTGKQAHVDYRGTILGANIKAPGLTFWENFRFSGKVEFDLQRTIDFDNKATVHLRHCYVEALSDEWRILIGQTWDVVSPLAPGTLCFSAGWMDGNVGYRRPQVRLERYFNVSPCFQWKLQGCLSSTFAGDSNSLLGSDYRLKYSSWPIVQGRISAVLGNRRCAHKPMEIGVAGHIGDLQYGQLVPGSEDINYNAKTWGVYLDAYIPISCRFGIQGELFKGENLAMFLGGINQGVMRSAAGTPESIAAQGGWINLWFNLNDYIQFRVGYMIDDPQGDIDEIEPGSALQARTLNHSLFANIKCDITKMWWVGLEYSHVETSWTGKETGVSTCDRVDLVSYFSF